MDKIKKTDKLSLPAFFGLNMYILLQYVNIINTKSK
jgi:hypothetical protein